MTLTSVNDFIYVYRCLGHTGGTHGSARVERNTQRLIIVLGTAAVKLAHKSEVSRHKIFFRLPRDKECEA